MELAKRPHRNLSIACRVFYMYLSLIGSFFSPIKPYQALQHLVWDGIFMESTFAAFKMGVSRKFQRNSMTLDTNVKWEVTLDKNSSNQFSNQNYNSTSFLNILYFVKIQRGICSWNLKKSPVPETNDQYVRHIPTFRFHF